MLLQYPHTLKFHDFGWFGLTEAYSFSIWHMQEIKKKLTFYDLGLHFTGNNFSALRK